MKFISCLVFLAFFSSTAFALKIDSMAPDFAVKSSEGKAVHLSDYKGKIVVLEWTNHGCPFVKKHYGSENMQKLQKEYTEKGVIWLSVISSAPGKQGHSSAKEAQADKEKMNASPTAILLDEKGEMGAAYSAKTTPHMFVINKEGKLVYQGAIDDTPSTDADDIKTSKNYVRAALDSVMAGKKVEIAQTKSYGCSVKY